MTHKHLLTYLQNMAVWNRRAQAVEAADRRHGDRVASLSIRLVEDGTRSRLGVTDRATVSTECQSKKRAA